MKPYVLGFALSGLAISAICMVVSIFAWDAKGMYEWGLSTIFFGVGIKAGIDEL